MPLSSNDFLQIKTGVDVLVKVLLYFRHSQRKILKEKVGHEIEFSSRSQTSLSLKIPFSIEILLPNERKQRNQNDNWIHTSQWIIKACFFRIRKVKYPQKIEIYGKYTACGKTVQTIWQMRTVSHAIQEAAREAFTLEHHHNFNDKKMLSNLLMALSIWIVFVFCMATFTICWPTLTNAAGNPLMAILLRGVLTNMYVVFFSPVEWLEVVLLISMIKMGRDWIGSSSTQSSGMEMQMPDPFRKLQIQTQAWLEIAWSTWILSTDFCNEPTISNPKTKAPNF